MSESDSCPCFPTSCSVVRADSSAACKWTKLDCPSMCPHPLVPICKLSCSHIVSISVGTSHYQGHAKIPKWNMYYWKNMAIFPFRYSRDGRASLSEGHGQSLKIRLCLKSGVLKE
jgi:hypothetical protein